MAVPTISGLGVGVAVGEFVAVSLGVGVLASGG
jgi:hypothetical protein